jgi:hypothetical protein
MNLYDKYRFGDNLRCNVSCHSCVPVCAETTLSPLLRRHTCEIEAIKMHSCFQMVDTSIESRQYHDFQWTLHICQRNCVFL